MSDETIALERVTEPTDEHVEALSRLIPQLSSFTPPSLADLQRIVADDRMFLFAARLDGVIVGSLCLATYAITTGTRAWIEDVVVDESARGRGVASALVVRALGQARELAASSVELTSRPSRVEANRLYQQLGFAARETNVYRYDLKG